MRVTAQTLFWLILAVAGVSTFTDLLPGEPLTRSFILCILLTGLLALLMLERQGSVPDSRADPVPDRDVSALPDIGPGMMAPPLPKETTPEEEERVEKIAEVFWDALYRDEDPDLEDYVDQYPEIGEPLRDRLCVIEIMYWARSGRVQDALSIMPGAVGARVLWLHLLDGLTFTQISERIRMDYRRVRQRYREGVRMLQKDLERRLRRTSRDHLEGMA